MHRNKYESFSKAEKVATQLSQQSHQTPKAKTIHKLQTTTYPQEPYYSSPWHYSGIKSYRCDQNLTRKTIAEAKHCTQYSPPNKCSSYWAKNGLCTVIQQLI